MKPSVDDEQVRLKAFELWQERGCPIGSPQDDWFMAKLSLETETESPAVVPRSLGVVGGDLPLGLRIVPDPARDDSPSAPPAPSSRRRRAQRQVAANAPAPAPAKAAGKRKGR